MNQDQLASHLRWNRFGEFTLTEAIRPGPGVPLRPREGYRIQVYRNHQVAVRLPMLSAAVSAERVFDTFLTLLDVLGEVVHVVLESSHDSQSDRHTDLRREYIDRPVLASHLCEFEDLLTHDGCTGIAILAVGRPVELQFDEHKLFHIYAPNLQPFRRVLRSLGIPRRRVLPLICEAEHLHHTTDEYADQFRQLALRLGVVDFDRVLSD